MSRLLLLGRALRSMNTQLIITVENHFYFFRGLELLLGVDLQNFYYEPAFSLAVLYFQLTFIYNLPPV